MTAAMSSSHATGPHGGNYHHFLSQVAATAAGPRHVRHGEEELDVSRIQDLAHHLESGLLLGFQEIVQTFSADPLEGVGARPRLVGPSPEHGGAACLHLMGNAHGQLQFLDRTRAGHDRDFLPADLDPTDVDNGILLLELTAYQFPRR